MKFVSVFVSILLFKMIYGSDRETLCNKVYRTCIGEVAPSIPAQIPVTSQGRVGKAGPRGPPGRDAVVNYTLIEANSERALERMFAAKMGDVIENITRGNEKLSQLLEAEQEKSRNLEEEVAKLKISSEQMMSEIRLNNWRRNSKKRRVTTTRAVTTPTTTMNPETLGVRLVNGESSNEGRVEVYRRGEWGTVCGRRWDFNNANVVCRMLGYSRATEVSCCAKFGRGTGRINLLEVNCNGRERSLFVCRDYSTLMLVPCGHDSDVGVVCE